MGRELKHLCSKKKTSRKKSKEMGMRTHGRILMNTHGGRGEVPHQGIDVSENTWGSLGYFSFSFVLITQSHHSQVSTLAGVAPIIYGTVSELGMSPSAFVDTC